MPERLTVVVTTHNRTVKQPRASRPDPRRPGAPKLELAVADWGAQVDRSERPHRAAFTGGVAQGVPDWFGDNTDPR